jgi:hypothetical protein
VICEKNDALHGWLHGVEPTDDARRRADGDAARRHVVEDDGIRADHRAAANRHAGADDDVHPTRPRRRSSPVPRSTP